MRGSIPVVLLIFVLAGCIDSDDLVRDRDDPATGGGEADPMPETNAGPVSLQEYYNGTVSSASGGDIALSPDQLGNVYRELWVHEGTTNMIVNVTTDEDIRFVLGQSDPSRDADSEETWFTEDGRLELEFEDPQTGGWYFIIFAPEEPGVHQADYEVKVTKMQGSSP